MKKDGIGGSNTTTGAAFEKKVVLATLLSMQKGYSVKDNNVYFNQNLIARLCKKHGFYEFLEENNIQWDKIISKQMFPDDAIYVINSNTMFIIEYKFQQVSGSVDEKLRSCDFKKKQYSKLLFPSIRVEYIFLLSDWFRQTKYKDDLEYINSTGCHYFFEDQYQPLLKLLGLHYLT
ncbi:MAG: hypothetical protein J6P19_06135 [Acetobacter sp.]|nr:hypothetical protein [Acetobacter sp.]